MAVLIIESFTRVFVDAGQLEKAMLFYKGLLDGKITLRFTYPETGLELAAVSSAHLSVLIICGPSDQRAPIEATLLTIQVDRLEPYVAKLNEAGLEQIQPVQKTPVGRNTRFRHPDGLIVEYVDHDGPALP
jgi:uncharacterized glyoxalase superfamily protein PhnB